jgi:hypothetical protein
MVPGGPSTLQWFEIGAASSLAPTLSAPANGASGISQTPTLTWSAVTGATSYDVYFGTSPTPPLVTNTTSTSYSPAALVTGTTYYWRIVGKNDTGSTTSLTFSFTVGSLPGGPAAPVLSAPANGAGGVSATPTLSWSAAAGAISYDVYVGTPLAVFVGNTSGTSFTPAALNAGATYSWQVVAKNSSGSTSSQVFSFTVQSASGPVTTTPPGVPLLLSPSNNATGIPTNAVLSWSPVPGATAYDVFMGTFLPFFIGKTSAASFNPGPLTLGATYYWVVVAENPAGSASSISSRFTVTH